MYKTIKFCIRVQGCEGICIFQYKTHLYDLLVTHNFLKQSPKLIQCYLIHRYFTLQHHCYFNMYITESCMYLCDKNHDLNMYFVV